MSPVLLNYIKYNYYEKQQGHEFDDLAFKMTYMLSQKGLVHS